MAAGVLPFPGKRVTIGSRGLVEIGPCIARCEHTDCAETRRMAEAVCPWCGWPVGYERRFYTNGGPMHNQPAHADCEADQVAK